MPAPPVPLDHADIEALKRATAHCESSDCKRQKREVFAAHGTKFAAAQIGARSEGGKSVQRKRGEAKRKSEKQRLELKSFGR